MNFDPAILLASVEDLAVVASNDVLNTPNGANDPGPARPGASDGVEFEAIDGDRARHAR